jgi:hypothetical protein
MRCELTLYLKKFYLSLGMPQYLPKPCPSCFSTARPSTQVPLLAVPWITLVLRRHMLAYIDSVDVLSTAVSREAKQPRCKQLLQSGSRVDPQCMTRRRGVLGPGE